MDRTDKWTVLYLKQNFSQWLQQQHHIKISHRFAALENLTDSEDINRAWENIKENIKTPAKESLWVYEVSIIIHGLMKNIYEF
jgi:hypothetical protein